ncbi:MAG: hypothetical protein ACXVEF_43515 [Polyangiales bacterium]
MKRLFLCAFLLVGCRTMTAGPSDYHDYRTYRLATGFGQKLGAGWRYLRDHPQGAFREEVALWFYPAEQRFWSEAGRTPGGAAAYVEYMPDGPHAEDERTFLRAFELEKKEGPLRAQRLLEAARKKAEDARRALGDAVETWTKRAISVPAFRVPLKDIKETEFGKAYQDDPPPVCDPDGCSKFLSYTYPVPEADPAFDRTAVVDVRLEITAGLVTAITISLSKRGFLYWMEGAENRPVDPSDPNAHVEAIARARNRVEKVVRDAKGASCTTTEADQARLIACGDLRVAIGTLPTGEDVVKIVSLLPSGG